MEKSIAQSGGTPPSPNGQLLRRCIRARNSNASAACTRQSGLNRSGSSNGADGAAHLSMMDWHSFLQVNLLPRRSLRGPLTSPALSVAISPVLQSGSSFTRERMDKVAPADESGSRRI